MIQCLVSAEAEKEQSGIKCQMVAVQLQHPACAHNAYYVCYLL